MLNLKCSIIITLLIINGITFAQWSNDSTINTPICMFSGNQTLSNIISDDDGGAIIVWEDYRGSSLDIYAQRINSAGVAQWFTDGVPICTASTDQRYPEIISDGNGGAIIVWTDQRNGFVDIYAQKINSAGIVQWAIDGVAVYIAANTKDAVTLISDGVGGAIITWSDNRDGTYHIYAQRVLSSGALLWDLFGVPICIAENQQILPAIAGDGFGGAFIAWQDHRSLPHIYAQYINSDGLVQWAANGVLVCNNAGQQLAPSIVTDGVGNAIIVWRDKRNLYNDLYAQSINSSGLLNWNIDGVPISIASGDQWVQNVISDDSGGAIVVWRDNRGNSEDIYAQKVNSFGSALWTTDGVPICTATNDQMQPDIIFTDEGDAIITWYDSRFSYNPDIYAQKIDGSGITEWTNNGIKICANNKIQRDAQIINDKFLGAIIVWNDLRNNNTSDIYAQQVDGNGNLGIVTDAVNESIRLDQFNLMQNYPNPFNPSTIISYQLPVSSEVTLIVYDVLGNEIATLVNEEKEPGIYETEFNLASSIKNPASGIYFYQLKAGDFVQTKKMLMIK